MGGVSIVLSASILWSAAPLCGAPKQWAKITGGMVSGVAGRDASITVFKGLPHWPSVKEKPATAFEVRNQESAAERSREVGRAARCPATGAPLFF